MVLVTNRNEVKNIDPLISCVCVTRNKPVMLERAVRCFLAQTYSLKELVLLYEDDDIATENFVKTMVPSSEIMTIVVPKRAETKLGELRNIAIQAANGVYVCQWDDDDWFHASRLEYNYKATMRSGKGGCIMKQWLVFDAVNNKAYGSSCRYWEGSIFCKKSILLSQQYENKSKGEDTYTIVQLLAKDLLFAISGAPQLYVYIYHGGNTWNYDHWKEIFAASSLLSDDTCSELAKIISKSCGVDEGSAILNRIAREHNIESV